MATTEPKARSASLAKGRRAKKKAWQRPTLEDVSAKILAQPYIRFT